MPFSFRDRQEKRCISRYKFVTWVSDGEYSVVGMGPMDDDETDFIGEYELHSTSSAQALDLPTTVRN